MPRENESAILDSARVHLTRLMDALERGTGPGRSRRMLPRLTASLVLAALCCAGCVGYSYVSNNLDSLRQTTPSEAPQTLPAAPPQEPGTASEPPVNDGVEEDGEREADLGESDPAQGEEEGYTEGNGEEDPGDAGGEEEGAPGDSGGGTPGGGSGEIVPGQDPARDAVPEQQPDPGSALEPGTGPGSENEQEAP